MPMNVDLPPEKADEQNDTARVAKAIVNDIVHLYALLKSIGLRGSSSIQVTTYGSSAVPDPSYCHFSISGVITPWSSKMFQCGIDLGPWPDSISASLSVITVWETANG